MLFLLLPHLHHHLEDMTEDPGRPSGEKRSFVNQSSASLTPSWAPGSSGQQLVSGALSKIPPLCQHLFLGLQDTLCGEKTLSQC